MQPWKQLKEPEVIKVGWRTLVRKTFERPDGEPAEYVTYDAPGSRIAVLIALTPDNKVIVAEQFRPGPEEYLMDMPGGTVDQNEEPLAAAIRELREETGYHSPSIEPLGMAINAYRNEKCYYFIAKDCTLDHEQGLDDGEFVNVKTISIDEFFENARTQKIGDLSGPFFAYDILQKINESTKQ